MPGEIDKLDLIEATHGVGHDIHGYAGRFQLADRPVRITAQGAIRVNERGYERVIAPAIINIKPLLKEIA